MSKRYLEKDFQREVNRYATPVWKLVCDVCLDPKCEHAKRLACLYAGPGWDYHHLDNDPWAPGKTRFQQKKPYDCRFTCPTPSGVAENHALELKVTHERTLALKRIESHQWDALLLADGLGANSYGWVVVCFADGLAREVLALRAPELDDWGRRHPSIRIEWARERGRRLRWLDVHLWKVNPDDRGAWDLRGLVGGR